MATVYACSKVEHSTKANGGTINPWVTEFCILVLMKLLKDALKEDRSLTEESRLCSKMAATTKEATATTGDTARASATTKTANSMRDNGQPTKGLDVEK